MIELHVFDLFILLCSLFLTLYLTLLYLFWMMTIRRNFLIVVDLEFYIYLVLLIIEWSHNILDSISCILFILITCTDLIENFIHALLSIICILSCSININLRIGLLILFFLILICRRCLKLQLNFEALSLLWLNDLIIWDGIGRLQIIFSVALIYLLLIGLLLLSLRSWNHLLVILLLQFHWLLLVEWLRFLWLKYFVNFDLLLSTTLFGCLIFLSLFIHKLRYYIFCVDIFRCFIFLFRLTFAFLFVLFSALAIICDFLLLIIIILLLFIIIIIILLLIAFRPRLHVHSMNAIVISQDRSFSRICMTMDDNITQSFWRVIINESIEKLVGNGISQDLCFI